MALMALFGMADVEKTESAQFLEQKSFGSSAQNVGPLIRGQKIHSVRNQRN
jgi:hypothetical protein